MEVLSRAASAPVVHRRTPENIERLAAAMGPCWGRPPPGLPFRFDAAISRGVGRRRQQQNVDRPFVAVAIGVQ
jgi:hypothetical protein